MKARTKKFIFAGTSPGLLERPLLYMVVVENDEGYGNDLFKANERLRARGVPAYDYC